MGLGFYALLLCSFCETGQAADLVIHSPSAPDITLQEVQFQRHSDTLGDISEFRATLSDAHNHHWMDVSVRVELKLKDGKSLYFAAGGKRDAGADSFEVYGF